MDNITTIKKYQNKSLQKQTERIIAMGGNIRKMFFSISAVIADVSKTECYKEDGFNNVHEWTKDAFGFKKSQSYAFLKIGNEYLSVIRDENNKLKTVKSNLTPDNAETDFGMTQIQKMLPLGHERAVQVVNDGTITPEMSVSEINKIVRNLTGETSDETPEATSEATPDETPEATPEAALEATPDETPEATQDETPEATPEAALEATPDENELVIELWDKDGKKYLLPIKVVLKHNLIK